LLFAPFDRKGKAKDGEEKKFDEVRTFKVENSIVIS